MKTKKPWAQCFDSLWDNNQILVAILGICSALAVTVNLQQALIMGMAVTFVTACSAFFVSLLRKWTPESVRMIAQLAVISTFVTAVDLFLKAYLYDMSKTLSVYVGLIITNCLVMGRCEAFARTVSPVSAFWDGMGAGLGYSAVLLIIAFFRELLGSGTIYGFALIPQAWYASAEHPSAYQNIGIFVLPPAAFFLLGAMIGVFTWLKEKKGA